MTLSNHYMFVRKKMYVVTGAADDAKQKKENKQKGKGPALPTLTATVDSVGNLPTMKSTSRPIDASDKLALADDADGASATTGASF
jgi:hypothetical protein